MTLTKSLQYRKEKMERLGSGVSDTESHILRMLIRAAIKIPSFGGLADGRLGRINRPEENPFKFPR